MKKEIMTNAWKMVKKEGALFAEALKMAWRLAKAILRIKEKDGVDDGTVQVNFWFGYGRKRAYIKRSWVSNYQNKCGYYIDLEDGHLRL